MLVLTLVEVIAMLQHLFIKFEFPRHLVVPAQRQHQIGALRFRWVFFPSPWLELLDPSNVLF